MDRNNEEFNLWASSIQILANQNNSTTILVALIDVNSSKQLSLEVTDDNLDYTISDVPLLNGGTAFFTDTYPITFTQLNQRIFDNFNDIYITRKPRFLGVALDLINSIRAFIGFHRRNIQPINSKNLPFLAENKSKPASDLLKEEFVYHYLKMSFITELNSNVSENTEREKTLYFILQYLHNVKALLLIVCRTSATLTHRILQKTFELVQQNEIDYEIQKKHDELNVKGGLIFLLSASLNELLDCLRRHKDVIYIFDESETILVVTYLEQIVAFWEQIELINFPLEDKRRLLYFVVTADRHMEVKWDMPVFGRKVFVMLKNECEPNLPVRSWLVYTVSALVNSAIKQSSKVKKEIQNCVINLISEGISLFNHEKAMEFVKRNTKMKKPLLAVFKVSDLAKKDKARFERMVVLLWHFKWDEHSYMRAEKCKRMLMESIEKCKESILWCEKQSERLMSRDSYYN